MAGLVSLISSQTGKRAEGAPILITPSAYIFTTILGYSNSRSNKNNHIPKSTPSSFLETTQHQGTPAFAVEGIGDGGSGGGNLSSRTPTEDVVVAGH